MRRLLAAAIVACAVVPGSIGAAGAGSDIPYAIVLGAIDRPIAGGRTVVAYNRNGTIFMDVVRATRTFSGLLTYSKGGGVATLTIGQQTGSFTVGSANARLNGAPWHLSAAPFMRDGDLFVPLNAIAYIAGATLKVDSKHRAVEIDLNSAPLPPAAEQTSDARVDETLVPSPARALALTPTATVDATGLHAHLEVFNVTEQPYPLTFTSGAQVAFIVFKDGTQVWSSLTGKRFTQSLVHLTLASHESRVFSAEWPGFSRAGPGRYTLRARLLTATPTDTSIISLGVFTPQPSPS